MLNVVLNEYRARIFLYLNTKQRSPSQPSNKRGDIYSGLFPDQVLLVRIGLKMKKKIQKKVCMSNNSDVKVKQSASGENELSN